MNEISQKPIEPEHLVVQSGIDQGRIRTRDLAQVGAEATNKAIDLKHKNPEANKHLIPELEGGVAMEKEVNRRAIEVSAALCADDTKFTPQGAGINFTLNQLANERKARENREATEATK